MKKMNNRWQSVLLSLALFGLAACTGDFEDINRNPNQVTDDQMDALNYKTGTKFKALQSLVIPVQEHMYQFNESLSGGPFGGYIGATVDTWQTKFETYNPSADWRKWPFANVITETYTPYKGIVNGTEDEVAIAFARLLRVAIMHRVTDSYGPIPYSKLESNESVYVEYDSQEAVYTKMFEELDEAIEILGRNDAPGRSVEPLRRRLLRQYRAVAQICQFAQVAHGHAFVVCEVRRRPCEGRRGYCRGCYRG